MVLARVRRDRIARLDAADLACKYETFANTLRVGRACDEAGYFWYEDPFKDGGVLHLAHRKLRKFLTTPFLLDEHVRGVEPKVDLVAAEAIDFVRADPDYDGGITGAMKIAHVAEGFGLDVEIYRPGRRTATAWPRSATPTTMSWG